MTKLRDKATDLKLKDVLSRSEYARYAKPVEEVTVVPTKVIYSTADIQAAKVILNRLLSNPARNEVASIKVLPKELEEI